MTNNNPDFNEVGIAEKVAEKLIKENQNKKRVEDAKNLGDDISFGEIDGIEQIIRRQSEDIFNIKYENIREKIEKQDEHIREKIEKQEKFTGNLIFGVVIAAIFISISIILSTWFFIQDYSNFQTNINELRKDNFEFKNEMIKEKYFIEKKEYILNKKESTKK